MQFVFCERPKEERESYHHNYLLGLFKAPKPCDHRSAIFRRNDRGASPLLAPNPSPDFPSLPAPWCAVCVKRMKYDRVIRGGWKKGEREGGDPPTSKVIKLINGEAPSHCSSRPRLSWGRGESEKDVVWRPFSIRFGNFPDFSRSPPLPLFRTPLLRLERTDSFPPSPISQLDHH